MKVYFIGAGPGAFDLMTIRGLNRLKKCPICIYAGSLIPKELLLEVPKETKLINSANLNLLEIIEEFKHAKKQNLDVARLHSGDPSIYGAIAEQMRALDDLNIAYEIVPGVPAFAAAAASLKQELTLPKINQSLIITRFSLHEDEMPEHETLENFAKSQATLAIHLSIKNIKTIQNKLIPYYGEDCPTVVAARISWPNEVIVRGTLANIAIKIQEVNIVKTAIIFVGRAMEPKDFENSKLYAEK